VKASVYEAQLHAQPERRQAVLGGWAVFTASAVLPTAQRRRIEATYIE